MEGCGIPDMAHFFPERVINLLTRNGKEGQHFAIGVGTGAVAPKNFHLITVFIINNKALMIS